MAKTVPAIALARKTYPEYDSDRLQAFFVCRNVFINDELVTVSAQKVPADAELEIRLAEKYVSRGGLKLQGALESFAFDFNPEGKTVIDAGSSTGGFTDCLLQHGAGCVHSVDVGYNQLDYSLRKDSRVVVHERQNIMTLESVEPAAQLAVADLSFRSISGAASHILSLVSEKKLIALIKPQFEMPKERIGEFDGVIKDRLMLFDVMLQVYRTLKEDGCGIHALIPSPIKGRKGNAEFLALIRPGEGLDEESFKELLSSLLS